jgi:hypothetical protein
MGLLDDNLERTSDDFCILKELIQKSGVARILYDAYGPEHIRMEIGDINNCQPVHLYSFYYAYDSLDVVIRLLSRREFECYSLHVNLNDII